jgi:hypothetical protein
MNAVKLLKQQHREVEELFDRFDGAKTEGPRRMIFDEIADALAIHAAIEERHFYPAVKKRQTEAILRESVEEHLEIKRVIADLLQMDAGDDQFEAKVKTLREDVETLFPAVERIFDNETLEAIGDAMNDTQEELRREGNPRYAIPGETDAAAPI